MKKYSGLRLLVVEDDFLQGDLTREAISEGFPGSEVEYLTTESELYERIPALAKKPPHIIVMDIKLPWEEMSETLKQPPEEVIREGDRRAGLRCWKRIAKRSAFSKTRVLFYSHVLDDDLKAEIRTLPSQPQFLSRSLSDTRRSSLEPLLKKIREMLRET